MLFPPLKSFPLQAASLYSKYLIRRCHLSIEAAGVRGRPFKPFKTCTLHAHVVCCFTGYMCVC